MEGFRLIADFVLAVTAAFIGGALAQRLGQPVIVGYLVAGLAVGPFTPGPTVVDRHSIEILSEMGVAFLMFALGAEISFGELRRLGRLAYLGGPLQILITMALGVAVAPVLGLSLTQGLFFGAMIALSSTVVVLKVLMARGEMDALHGRVALGILIAQDIAVVPMVIILPALAGGGERILIDLAIAAAKVAVVLLGVYFVGVRLVPFLLTHAALTKTRELFILSIVALALGTAVATQAAGLSLAFGAFLAGLVVAESEFRTQVIAEISPLRDLFAALFFVAIGMLLNPLAIAAQWELLAILTIIVVVGKALVGVGVVMLLGVNSRAALLVGLGIAQVGEFSFVLARIGVTEGAIPQALFDLTLATAVISIILTPSLLRLAPILTSIAERTSFLHPDRGNRERAKEEMGENLSGHVVICGYGRVGKQLADELAARNEPHVVVEYNAQIVHAARAQGVNIWYGDAGNPVVLAHAGIERARLLAVLVPDSHSAELTTRNARSANITLDIIARASQPADVGLLWRAGATEVVQPEFEAGLEVLRHTLHRYDVQAEEIEQELAERRELYYRT